MNLQTSNGGIYDPVVQVDLALSAGVPGEDIPGEGKPAPGQGWGGGSGGTHWWDWWIKLFFNWGKWFFSLFFPHFGR